MFWYTLIKERKLEALQMELESNKWLLKWACKEIQMNRENKKRIVEMESGIKTNQ